MRRLMLTARSFLIHSSHLAVLATVAAFAAAAAPLNPASLPEIEVGHASEVTATTAVVHSPGPVTRLIAFSEPVRGYAINSSYGLRRLADESAARHHDGVDIAAPLGTSVYVASEGVVLRTGYDPDGYGRFIEVQHPNGMTTLYGHLSRVDVASGTAVTNGERIGLVGSTGRSTGPHLHFEVRRNDRQINPTRVLGRSLPAVVAQAT
ncbi:MAG: peptidase M23 [Alphaproteobacteria bacterium]|nr:MAG: peptidase M23 [Alphaproteobacteria bacterium]